MKDLVCVELRKAFGSKMFAASIIIGSALSVATSFINYFTIYHASYMRRNGLILRFSRAFDTGW